MTKSKRASEFEFTLLLEGIDELTSEIEDALFDAECDGQRPFGPRLSYVYA